MLLDYIYIYIYILTHMGAEAGTRVGGHGPQNFELYIFIYIIILIFSNFIL